VAFSCAASTAGISGTQLAGTRGRYAATVAVESLFNFLRFKNPASKIWQSRHHSLLCMHTNRQQGKNPKQKARSLSLSPEPTCSISFIAHPALSFLFYPGGSFIIHGDGGCWVGVLELAIWIFSRGLLKRPCPLSCSLRISIPVSSFWFP